MRRKGCLNVQGAILAHDYDAPLSPRGLRDPMEDKSHLDLTHHTPEVDYGVAAIEPVLLLQPLEDALCCVALLLRRAQVVFEYAVMTPV